MSLHSPGATAVALHKDRHIRYWLRCLRTLLPTAYTSNDTIRLTLAYFTLSALDVLCGLETQTTGFERADFAEWIYHCQHPAGGFRGSPATYLGDEASPDATTWDPPNLPATFFAIAALIVLGDDLKRLQRRKCLEVLPKFQRQNGSFGEVLGEGGNPDGGTSMRFAYFAAVLRWILRSGRGQQDDDVEDIDVDALLGFIGSARTYDGGYAEMPYHEGHAGLTYCAISALEFLDRSMKSNQVGRSKHQRQDIALNRLEYSETVRWLVSRQTAYKIEEDEELPTSPGGVATSDHHATSPIVHHFSAPVRAPEQSGEEDEAILSYAGFNGRINKLADTCYSFWVCGSLATLGQQDLVSIELNRNFLLDQTQHRIGGFGKLPGDVPDILHSYLGLASLAVLGEQGLKPLDAALCVTLDARKRFERLAWWRRNVERDEHPSITDTAPRLR